MVVNVNMVDNAAACPYASLFTQLKMATDIVIVLPVYKISVALNVLITLTRLSTAPEIKPGIMRCTVVLKNVFMGGTPRLMDASSTELSIWYRIPTLERIV